MKTAALYLGTATAIGAGLVHLTSRYKAPSDSGGESLASLKTQTPSTPPTTPAPSGEAVKPSSSVPDNPAPPAPKINYDTDETKNTFAQITQHNNFYEFGTGKSDPAANA